MIKNGNKTIPKLKFKNSGRAEVMTIKVKYLLT